MEIRKAYYISKLKDGLLIRQESNPRYSMRAYARDLNIDSSTLSQILNGKRAIPSKNAREMAEKLSLDSKETTLFIESINRSAMSIDDIKIASLDQRFMLDESYFKVIAEWEHYAVLDLFDLDDFEPTKEYIRKRLDLTEGRTDLVLNNLMSCGLLVIENGKLKKAHPDIKTTEDARGEALNQAHLEELDLAKEKLRKIDKSMRDFSSATFAVDPEKMDEAKTIIREFRQKMGALLQKGDKKEVYMLAIQFFPLTDLEE
ncbi:MAG: TIGR02147 family protein [Bacteriovoracaceae bacterium]